VILFFCIAWAFAIVLCDISVFVDALFALNITMSHLHCNLFFVMYKPKHYIALEANFVLLG